MAIRFEDYEQRTKYKGDYDEDLAAVQKRLAKVQVAHIVHKRRSIIAFEGWDAAGKGGIIQRLTAGWDPRHFEVWPIAAPTPVERARHFLWRFWNKLPGAGEIAVFDRTWYGRVLVERVEGFASEAEWRRGYDEIAAFESGQIADGTNLIKLFVHVSQEEQDDRLKARLEHPWKRWKLSPDDFRNRAKRHDYLVAIEEMIERTDTAAAPWKLIDGNSKKAARIEALTWIADQLEAAIPMEPPPPDPDVVAAAKQVWGKLHLD